MVRSVFGQWQRVTRRRWAGLVLAACGATVLASHAGCAGGTGSKRFAFEASVGGSEDIAPGAFTFTNQTGWTITLTRADMTIGPVYLNVVPPLRDPSYGLLDVFIRPAWAEGQSHLADGRIVGEVLSQVQFSALSPALVAMPVPGSITQEQVRTAEVWFYPAPGVSADATKIATVALDVAGQATRGASTIRFRGALKLDDAWLPDVPSGTRGVLSIAELRKVRGIQASFFPSEGGRLEIRVDVKRFFRGADFSNLDANPIDADGTKVLVQSKTGKVTTDQVMTNLYQGLREAEGSYNVRWIDP
jgi:hypothetical protein